MLRAEVPNAGAYACGSRAAGEAHARALIDEKRGLPSQRGVTNLPVLFNRLWKRAARERAIFRRILEQS